MKKLCLILALLMSATMTGCGAAKDSAVSNNATSKDVTASANTATKAADKVSTAKVQYDLTKATYSAQNVKINYPQINNLSDSGKQQKINELIKTSALQVLNDYQDSLSSLSLTMDYEVKYQGADLLSIEYLGLANVKNAAHPVNLIQTTNIDLAKGKQLAISDVVTVNDSFAEKIKAGKYKAYSSDLDLEAAGALKDVLNGVSSQDLLENFKQQTAKFYFAKGSLGVCVEVAHAVGDHLELELEYNSLGELLLVKPQGSVELSSGSTSKNSVGSTVTATTKLANKAINVLLNNLEKADGKIYAVYDDYVWVSVNDEEGIKELKRRNIEVYMDNDYQTYDDTPGQNEKLEIDSKAVISVILRDSTNAENKPASLEEFYNNYTSHSLLNNKFKINITNNKITQIEEVYTP